MGAILQLISQTLRPWRPPFPLLALTFFFSGLGQAYQDSHANTFVARAGTGAHRWLGFIHAMYGIGCLVSPFVATSIASRSQGSGWMLFYLFPLGMNVINNVAVGTAFRDSIRIVKHVSGEAAGERSRSAMKEVRQMMKIKSIWLLSLFFFFYLGVSFTAGGMFPYESIYSIECLGLISENRMGRPISRSSSPR
jgi:fucose permease